MAINSLGFLLFVAIVSLLYFILPKKIKWFVLLASSYVFYWLNSNWLIIYMIVTSLSIYLIGLRLGSIEKKRKILCKSETDKEKKKIIKAKAAKRKKIEVFLAIVVNIGILIALKYCNFLAGNLNSIFESFNISINIPLQNIILPLGISYYTLQAISYIVDVYRGKYDPDKNIGRLALFVSFFPQMVEGPIGRYDELAKQLYEPHKFEYKRVKFALQLMMWGYFKKIVIADRAGLFVNEVIGNCDKYAGIPIFFAAILYTVQIYAEFSGCIDIVRGVGQIFGVDMAENFKRPFFSKSVQEFWRRWHITLGTWFKDYVFYPISFSKFNLKISGWAKKTFKNNYFSKIIPTIIALLIVWFGTGIWHGASWKYVVYGLYYYIIMVLGMLLEPLGNKLIKLFKINKDNFSYRLWQMFRTTMFVVFGMLLFRSVDLGNFGTLVKNMISLNNLEMLSNGKLFNIGLQNGDFNILVIGIIIIFVVDLLQERGHNLREKISNQNIIFRWTLYYACFFAIVIFGIYGAGYNASDFIYGQF